MPRPGPVVVKLTYKKNVLTLDDKKQKEVKLNWKKETKPDEVTWKIQGNLGTLAVKVLWSELGAPFSRVETSGKKTIHGRYNKRIGGIYPYSVVVYDPDTEMIVAGIDPRIVNDPYP